NRGLASSAPKKRLSAGKQTPVSMSSAASSNIHSNVGGVSSMTNMSRATKISVLILVVGTLAATSRAQNRPPIAEEVAKTYGLDSWGQVEAIRYIFKVQFPGVNLSRSWEWEPKTGKVTYQSKDKDGKPVKVTYLRSQLNSQPADVKA